jgi:hypothetical protein
MDHRWKPINHNIDERCHTATGESQDCSTTVGLFEGTQKLTPSGALGRGINIYGVWVDALEVFSSRPRANFVMMRKGGRKCEMSESTLPVNDCRRNNFSFEELDV